MPNVRKSAFGARRVEFRKPISEVRQPFANTLTSPPITTELPTPLEAAMAISAEYIATLHSGLITFLTSLSQACLGAYSDYYQNTAKSTEMRLNPHHIPTSVKKIKLRLQPLDEIKESEGVKALQHELDAEIEELQRKLRDKYVRPLEVLNGEAYKRRFHITICQMMRKAAQAFIAQLNIRDYSEDKAVMDLFSSQRAELLLKYPLPIEISHLLQLYKEANTGEISKLPLPTTQNDETTAIINQINGVTCQTDKTSENPVTNIVTNNNYSPSSSMTSTSGSNMDRTPSDNTTPREHINIVTPRTIANQGTLELPPLPESLPEPQRPLSPPPTEMQPNIQGTDFVTASSALAASLMNNLEASANQSTADSEGDNDNHNKNDYILTQDMDEQYKEIDLESIEMDANRRKLTSMLHTLYVNTIKLPIDKYHLTLTQREELVRIRRVTSSSLNSSLTAKVASKIQAERPADRPVLAGLIREETEKNTSLLRNQLKSATDKLERVQQKQNAMIQEFQLKRMSTGTPQNNNTSKNREAATRIEFGRETTEVAQQLLPQPH